MEQVENRIGSLWTLIGTTPGARRKRMTGGTFQQNFYWSTYRNTSAAVYWQVTDTESNPVRTLSQYAWKPFSFESNESSIQETRTAQIAAFDARKLPQGRNSTQKLIRPMRVPSPIKHLQSMAKTPKLKKSTKRTPPPPPFQRAFSETLTNTTPPTAPSLHSRASKRLTSPTLNLDKSLTSLKPPAQSQNQRPSILAVHHGAGISKKKAKGKALSRAQKRRQEKGLERAEIVMDQTEKKVERGVGRRKGGRERKVSLGLHGLGLTGVGVCGERVS